MTRTDPPAPTPGAADTSPGPAPGTGLRNIHWLWLAVATVVLDQWTKALINDHLPYGASRPVTEFFNLVHARNTGAAFSMFNTLPPGVFIGIGTLVALGVAAWLWKTPYGRRVEAAGFSLVAGGAVGNIIDRARQGHVTDFLDFHAAGWHFAAFNVADSAITLGVLLMFADLFLSARRPRRDAPGETAGGAAAAAGLPSTPAATGPTSPGT